MNKLMFLLIVFLLWWFVPEVLYFLVTMLIVNTLLSIGLLLIFTIQDNRRQRY